MKVVGVTMVRDEADVVAHTVESMLGQVDAVVVADNLSRDGTSDVLRDLHRRHADRMTIALDPEPAYLQSEKMSRLAQLARGAHRADWIVPFDADEVWYSPFGRIADVLADVPEAYFVVPAQLFDHVATGLDADVDDPIERIQWRRPAPAPLPKVAARWRDDLVIHQGNHGAHYHAFVPGPFDPILVVRHFPYRSVEQFLRKVRNGAAAYRAAGDRQPEHAGAHWRQWGKLLEERGEEAVAEIFRKWYWRADPTVATKIDKERQPALVHDPARYAIEKALE